MTEHRNGLEFELSEKSFPSACEREGFVTALQTVAACARSASSNRS